MSTVTGLVELVPGDEPGQFRLEAADGSNYFGDIWGEENAHRVAACWNICIGITTDVLEVSSNLDGLWNDVIGERDALLALLKKIKATDDESIKDLRELGLAIPPEMSEITNEIGALIAKIETGTV